ncbi:hypothetical protein ILYODFUR_016216, partial [Ilyodon furcidens]
VVKLFAEAICYAGDLDTTSLFHYRQKESQPKGASQKWGGEREKTCSTGHQGQLVEPETAVLKTEASLYGSGLYGTCLALQIVKSTRLFSQVHTPLLTLRF